MNDQDHPFGSAARLEAGLRRHRPRLDSLELDRLRRQVDDRISSRQELRRSGGFMRSRLALTLTVVFGLTFSGAGGALALSGSSGGVSAGSAQYRSNSGTHNGSGVLGFTGSGSGSGSSGGGTDSGAAGANARDAGSNASDPGTNAAQSSAQVEATGSGKTLPFTGYAAIPVLLIGVALLGTGLVLRRRTREG